MREMYDAKRGSIRNFDGTGIKPLHTLQKAASRVFDPNDPEMSCIFRVSFNDFQSLSTTEMQTIFQDRHILIYDIPPNPKWKWSLECLEELCPGGIFIEVQGTHQQAKVYYISLSCQRHEKQRSSRW